MINKSYKIDIIKGDTIEKNIIISGINNEDIEKVYLSSKEINIDKELTYDSNTEKWVFRLESNETKDLKEINTDFDITMKLVSSDVLTLVYRGVIQVYPKINKVGDLDNE